VIAGRNHTTNWLFGSGISIGIAAALIYLVRGSERTTLVPIGFIFVVVLCARFFGLLAGVLGSIGASGMFACFLFQPYGTFRISDHEALSNVGLLLFAGIALSYANSERSDERPNARALKP
jgi:K+-sensing histidine kinase KdpD